MKITTVTEVREVEEHKIGRDAKETIGSVIDKRLERIMHHHFNNHDYDRVVKEIIINVEEFIKEVIAND